MLPVANLPLATRNLIRKHHGALHVPCGDVHRVNSLL
jgi:hypothetical protein